MRFVARLFARDLVEFSRSRGPLTLVFVVPVVLLLLIGNLRVRDPTVRVAIVAAAAAPGVPKPPSLTRLESALKEIASLEVVRWDSGLGALRERSARERIDLVVVADGDTWRFHSPLTNAYRAQFARGVAQDLALSMQRYAQFDDQAGVLEMLRRDLRASVIAGQRTALADDAASATSANAAASKPAPIEHAIETVDQLAQKAARDAAIPTPVLRAWLANRLDFYFPLVSQVDHSLVPGFVALIAVFLPFLLASGALVREREAGTLETMILAARRNWVCMAAGKLILPVSVTMLSVLLLLVAARTAFGFGIKPGFLQALGIQLLAGVVSAVFGLSVSTLIKSSQDAYTTSSAYLVACILITGLIYPVEQAANAVAAVSYLFPLTLAAPALEGWMVNGANVTVESWRWYGLIGQLAAAVALCGLAVQRLRKSL